MNQLKYNWEPLKITKSTKLAEASNTLHHAAQFLALVARSFIPEKADDSHTTATWNPDISWLVGQNISAATGNVRLALDYNDMSLLIVDEHLNTSHRKVIIGLTKAEVLLWLKGSLNETGLDTSLFVDKMHYEIPPHPVDDGGIFSMEDPSLMVELARYRTNGHLLLEHFAKDYKSAQAVLVWPHHFDEGCYIPLQFEGDIATGSFSIGMAMADGYYSNPYFYVTTWKRDGVDYTNLPSAPNAGKWHTNEWTGQVLETKDLLSLNGNQQLETSMEFLETAIENARRLIGWVYK